MNPLLLVVGVAAALLALMVFAVIYDAFLSEQAGERENGDA